MVAIGGDHIVAKVAARRSKKLARCVQLQSMSRQSSEARADFELDDVRKLSRKAGVPSSTCHVAELQANAKSQSSQVGVQQAGKPDF